MVEWDLQALLIVCIDSEIVPKNAAELMLQIRNNWAHLDYRKFDGVNEWRDAGLFCWRELKDKDAAHELDALQRSNLARYHFLIFRI